MSAYLKRELDLDLVDDGYLGEMKWYDHEKDVAALSRAFPGFLFHLLGAGENEGDLWDLYALDGRVQRHHAVIQRVSAPKTDGWRAPKST